MTRMVLVHSPSVGPSSWVDCARRLLAQGFDVVVPDLRHIGGGGPPYAPRVAASVADAMGQLDSDGPVTVVAHSNAGLFVPAIVEASPQPVAAVVFVDAVLPVGPGVVAVAEPQFLAWLHTLADPDGLLPRWSDWWPSEDMAQLLPDPRVRATVVADQPRLPVDYYEQHVPVPPGWPSVPGAYLQFTDAYDPDAAVARAFGWPVEVLRGEHLHQVVDPDAVTAALRRLVSE
jgi:pimeloyl-ACP methyl ester carboxylesterase